MWRTSAFLLWIALFSLPAQGFSQGKQGRLENTGRVSDLAIDGGGFLILEEEGRGEFLYTRFGNLSLDARGRFADSEGRLLLGFDPNASDPETDPLIAIDL